MLSLRSSPFVRAILITTAWLLASPGPAAGAPADAVRFNRDIRPILSDNCFACHGPDEDDRGGDLRLDVRAEAIADRGGMTPIVPGKPEESEILRRILSHDADEVMPPPRAKKPKLTAAQVDLLRRWIRDGAVYQNHWAFEPIERVTPPATPSTSPGSRTSSETATVAPRSARARCWHGVSSRPAAPS